MADQGKLKYTWVHGEDETYRQIILNQYNNPALVKLKKILIKELEEVQSRQNSEVNYDSPSWQYQQADFIGQIRTLKDVLTLLDFVKDNNK